MTIGEELRKARAKLGKTQLQIATELGKSQPSVQQWESDATLPRTEDVRAVAKAYGLDPEQLLPGIAA